MVLQEALIDNTFEIGVGLEKELVGMAGGVVGPAFGGRLGGGDGLNFLLDDMVGEGAGGDDLLGDAGTLPEDAQGFSAAVLEEIAADGVFASAQGDGSARDLAVAVQAVVVDDELAVDPEAGAVVGAGGEGVGAVRGDVDVAFTIQDKNCDAAL